MIHDAERVPLHESHPDLAERGVRDPLIAVLPDLGARQPCGPARQVSRVGSELVDLGWPASDVDADMLDVVHRTTSLERAGSDAKDKNAKAPRHSRPARQWLLRCASDKSHHSPVSIPSKRARNDREPGSRPCCRAESRRTPRGTPATGQG